MAGSQAPGGSHQPGASHGSGTSSHTGSQTQPGIGNQQASGVSHTGGPQTGSSQSGGSQRGSGQQASGTASSSPQTTASGISAKSHETAEHLKSAAIDQVDHIRERADSAKEHAIDRIRRLGSAVRSASDGLRTEDEFIAGYADALSQRIDTVAEYLGSADARTLVRDTEQFARQKPAVFFGGAFLLGLAAARFVKSSRDNLSSDASTYSEGSTSSYRGTGRMTPPTPPSERRSPSSYLGNERER